MEDELEGVDVEAGIDGGGVVVDDEAEVERCDCGVLV